MKIEFLPFAKEDFDKAIMYYEEIDNTLAQRFKDEVRASIDRIIYFPESYPLIKGDIRKCILRIFPYSIYYLIENKTIFIYAVAHHHRNFAP